jgi:hypothetical protein
MWTVVCVRDRRWRDLDLRQLIYIYSFRHLCTSLGANERIRDTAQARRRRRSRRQHHRGRAQASQCRKFFSWVPATLSAYLTTDLDSHTTAASSSHAQFPHYNPSSPTPTPPTSPPQANPPSPPPSTSASRIPAAGVPSPPTPFSSQKAAPASPVPLQT